MRRARKFTWLPLFAVLTFAVAVVPMPVGAAGFFTNLGKQLEQAVQQVKQATQHQSPQQQSNQPQAPQSEPTSANTLSSADPTNASMSYSACCTPEAMKKYAKQASVHDIVGIRLGMSPKEAFAAIRASNPKLRIEVLKSWMQVPGIPESRYPKIPHYVLAHTVGTVTDAYQLPDGRQLNGFYRADTGSDVIQIEFTTPPNPPLVAKIVRTVMFPQGHPVYASKLLTALREKYGHENVLSSGSMGDTVRKWIYGPDGHLLRRQLTENERFCGGTGADGVAGLGLPTNTPGSLTVSGIYWDKYAKARGYSPQGKNTGYPDSAFYGYDYEAVPTCIPFTIVTAEADFVSPNTQNVQLSVSTESPALLYASYRSTQEWMEARAEAAQRKEQQSVKKNAAPQL